MRQTVRQYINAIKKIYPDVIVESAFWPYPQAGQSHLSFRRPDWTGQEIRVKVVNTDIEGAVIRVADNAPMPKEIAQTLEEVQHD